MSCYIWVGVSGAYIGRELGFWAAVGILLTVELVCACAEGFYKAWRADRG